MVLGTDVSGLTTTAANAAAQGLSIVVPAYNEAAGLALLHQRLGGLAKALRQRYSIGCQGAYVANGRPEETPRNPPPPPPHGPPAPTLPPSRTSAQEPPPLPPPAPP